MSAPVVETDRTRKHFLGLQARESVDDQAWSGAYSTDTTERVYAAMLDRARSVLRSRRPVILDATFRSRDFRARAARLAQEFAVPFWFVECKPPLDACRRRLEQRDRESSVSDGRLEIFDDFMAKWEPVDELPDEHHITLDTTRDLDRNIQALKERLPLWPPGSEA